MAMDIMAMGTKKMKKRVHDSQSGGKTHARHHHHHRTHHKVTSPGGRRQRLIRVFSCLAVCLVVLAGIGIFFWKQQREQSRMQITAGNVHDVGSGYRNIEYQGKKYQYNNLITCILYAGIDSEGKMEATVQYGNKARADSIGLVIMDELHKKLSILPINRDTMTKIRKYSLNGNDNGLYTTHIGYAYSYGDGGKASCENLCEAVSRLLGNIPVNRYVVTNRDTLPWLNNLVGGITVTVPNSDLEEQYPELVEGAEVTIDNDMVTDFLQYRNTEETFSNEGRMERQKSYVSAYINELQAMTDNQLTDVWDKFSDAEDNLQTSITKNQYLDLVKTMKNLSFSEDNYLQIEGTDQEGELHDEFYPDIEALQKKILELFYLED